MKNLITSAFVITFAHFANADEFEKKYGSGVVHIATDSITQINFYSSPGSAVTHRLEFVDGVFTGTPWVAALDSTAAFPDWFSTLFLMKSEEYARVDLIALDSLKEYYRTILIDGQGQEVWVKKAPHVQFLSWFGFYNTMSSIEMENDTVILFEKADAKSKRVNYTSIFGRDRVRTMTPLRVSGYWMEVEIEITTQDPVLHAQKYTGWILWRNDQRPLVTYNLMGC